ncbi:MAG TPA: FdhF/YdeP family oxidoreductase [Pyrinomonadaceae bacterium]|jgi:molybdopterin-dependent oxidoreductase alpha subunit|nr:FdhF/YdeP family oxidoreductase [Pyrinomonadaceae bacterium]
MKEQVKTEGQQQQQGAPDQKVEAHPSHYEPAKHDLKSEREMRAGEVAASTDDPAQREPDAASNSTEPAHASRRAQPPEDFTGIKVSHADTAAGGLPAIMSAMKHSLSEMGATRTLKTLTRINQKGGFDCPGCAWPEPDGERTHFEFCENGAKHVADEATTKRITPDFFRRWSVSELSRQTDMWLNDQGRLTHPMLLRRGSDFYEPVTWDEAFKLIAAELNALATPDEAVFYTSGRTSNEAAFLYQLFVRAYGTNNLPDCSNMCHESSGSALSESIGVGKGTVTLEDFAEAEAIFVIGQNPGTNHPRMLSTLQAAKRRGCRIVHINPLPEAGMSRFKHPQEIFDTLLGSGTQLADLFLQVRINGDVALLQGISKEVLEAESRRAGVVLDHDFIDAHTTGFTEFAASLDKVGWNEITESCGIAREEIQAAARIFIESKRTIFCWAMGLTQHKNAVANIQEIVNLLLLRGQIGQTGAGVCPVRGHSNVQGDRTMGIWERPTPAFLDALAKEFDFAPPRTHGFDTVEAIKAMHARRAKVFFAMGGNFLSATPDTEYTAEALRRLRLTVQVSTKLNRAHLITGEQALILPCLGRTEIDRQATGEQFVSAENSMGVVQSSRGNLEPASTELLSEVSIVAQLAEATFTGTRGAGVNVNWLELAANYDLIRERISRVVVGFENYNERVRHPGGFYLPNLAREREWKTASGKAHFTVHELPRHALAPGQFLMMTIRSHDQFNTTIYGLDDRYRGIRNERRVVLLNPADIREAGLTEGSIVDLTSHFEGEERIARRFIVVPYSIPRRSAATYFPETNVLVPIRSVADKSNTPVSKSVVISLRPAATT